MTDAQAVHLRIDQVTKRFGTIAAVDDVTLAIPRGAFATLLGPSGCGKTTLLRMIAGFYEPDSGAIYLGDKRIDGTPSHQRGTAMVFQDYALFPHMTVGDNVSYGLRLAGLPKPQIARRVMDILLFVGLGALADRWPHQLSGGQQQRVALARALIVEPKVLLLDEPLSNLDAILRERMRWELRALQNRLNMTFLYVTHDQSEALAMSDWVAVMNAGRVAQWGTPREIYSQPRNVFVANFIGSANLRPITVIAHQGDTLLVALNDHRFAVSAPDAEVGDDLLLCIRPEAMTIGRASPNDSCISLRGTITRWAFLGPMTRYWVQIEGDEWIVDQADVGATDAPYEGEITLSFWPNIAHVVAAS